MIKKNILFITGQFLPYTQSVGGIIRIYSFLQTLKNKYNLHLLTSSGTYYGYLGISKKNLKKIKITYLKKKNNLLFNDHNHILARSLFYNKIFINIFYLLGIDYSFFFVNQYFKETIKIIDSKKINYIIISAPPFSLFFLIKKIKLLYPNIKIIIDYRDGWTGRINSILLVIIKKFVECFIEKNIIRFADSILAATNSIKISLSLITKKKIILLTNGFLNISKRVKLNKSKKILIGYFGLISDKSGGYRNISIIHNVLKKNNLFLKKYSFTFYGNNKIVNSDIKNFSCFKFKKNISYNKVLFRRMSKMDYLLILHTDKNTAKEVITGKLYEYIASRTPIIFISAGETEGGKVIKKNKLGYSINYLENNLEHFFLNLKKNSNLKQKTNIQIFSRKFQNKKLFLLLK
jgi:glycosyltransferase involved in cell wall biosynthesis